VNGEHEISPLLERFKFCPCNQRYPLAEVDNQVAIYCENKRCYVQVEKKIQHFVSKKAVYIEGLGPKTIANLLDYEAIRDLSDLFYLRDKYESLVSIPGLGKKALDKIIESIDSKKKEVTPPDLLYGLGISNIGKETAVALCQKVTTFSALQNISEDSLCKMGLGEKSAHSMIE